MEGKKISFGFMKTKKADKPVTVTNDERKEYIECVEEQSIKVVGGEIEKTDLPLVIPMKPNTLMNSERYVEIALKVESAIDEPEIKSEPIAEDFEDPLAENETLDQMAVRELMQEAKKTTAASVASTMQIPTLAKGVAEGEKESTLDDYEAIPVKDFGVAMLRGMGWTPCVAVEGYPQERAAQPSQAQVHMLLNFLEKNPFLAKRLPKSPSQKIAAQNAWEKIASILNKKKGSCKTSKQWTKYWADKKSSIKKKAAKNKNCDPREVIELTEVEERVIAIMGCYPANNETHVTPQHITPIQLSFETQCSDPPTDIIVETTEECQNTENQEILRNNESPSPPVVLNPQIELTDSSHQRAVYYAMPIPSVEGVFPSERLPTKSNTISKIESGSPNPSPSGEGLRTGSPVRSASPRRRRRRILPTTSQRRRYTHFSNIAERFLRIEERRLENDRRITEVLESVTSVVNENNRMMSEALLSIGEGLKLLAEAVKRK